MENIEICGHKIPIIGEMGIDGKITFYEKEIKMTDKIEITVKVNGVETPLHKVSEQTLLNIRENSKPKEVPVARTADFIGRRLILRVPENISNFMKADIIVIDLDYGHIVNHWNLNKKTPTLYENIQVIS